LQNNAPHTNTENTLLAPLGLLFLWWFSIP